jgi:hypothetical protein
MDGKELKMGNDQNYKGGFVRSSSTVNATMHATHMTGSSMSMGNYGPCRACGRTNELDNRGLCFECEDIIPKHIPSGQHKRYRDRVILGKLPNT